MYVLTTIFIGTYYIAPYIQHNCLNVIIAYTSISLFGVPFVQYMDTHKGWWTQRKLVSKNDSSKKHIPFWDIVPTVICNNLFGSLLSYYYVENFGQGRGFHSTAQNNLLLVCYQFLQLFLTYDIIFFIGHYIIHIPPLYRMIHKKHHLTFADMAITAHYMTFSDYVLEVLFPFWGSIYIINPCFTTTLIFAITGQINALVIHSGYNLPGFKIPIYHYYHHTKNNINYGSGGLSYFIESYLK